MAGERGHPRQHRLDADLAVVVMEIAIGAIVAVFIIASALRVRDAYSGLSSDVIETPMPVRHIVALVHGTWPRGFLGLAREIRPVPLVSAWYDDPPLSVVRCEFGRASHARR
jgi:hypothetical protein